MRRIMIISIVWLLELQNRYDFYMSLNARTPPSMHHCGIKTLVHLLNEAVDVIFTVTKVSSFNEVLELAGTESASWV